jgi:hypothetical protein
MLKGGAVAGELSEEALPSLKTLWQIAKQTEAESEVASSKISSVGWKQFADTAYRGAAEASAAGNKTKAIAFNAAALGAKAYSKYESAWAWLGDKLPGAPIGIKLAMMMKMAKEGVDWVTKTDEEK